MSCRKAHDGRGPDAASKIRVQVGPGGQLEQPGAHRAVLGARGEPACGHCRSAGFSARRVKADARWRTLLRKESLMTTSPGPAHETAATADGAALTFGGVDHVILTITNLDVSAKFYTEVRGYTVVLDFEYGMVCMHKTTGFMLSLIRHPDGTGTRFTQRQTGLDHLGFTARNKAGLLGWERRLRELDVEFTPVQDSDLGHQLIFRFPDGFTPKFSAPSDRFAAALDEMRSREFSDEELLDGAEQLGLGAYVAQRVL